MTVSTYLDARRQSDLARDPNHDSAQVAYDALQVALAARGLVPTDACKRAGFDADFGSFTGHPADPRTDDERMTEDEAIGEAQDQILSHAESTADWLAKECDNDAGRLPKDVSKLSAMDYLEATPAVCWATILTGNTSQITRAAYRLRELALIDHGDLIRMRAAEILAGQE